MDNSPYGMRAVGNQEMVKVMMKNDTTFQSFWLIMKTLFTSVETNLRCAVRV